MSRSRGATSLTTRSPILSEPDEASSSPATIRSAVDLPLPDGPTRMVNSPSVTDRSSPSTALVPSSKTFETSSNAIEATAHLPDVIAIPERGALQRTLLGGVVDAHDAEALVVAVLPLEVVQQRPRVVAPDVHAGRARLRERVEVLAQERHPRRVLDHAVDELLVVEGGAVLGDPDLQIAVVRAQPQQQVIEAARVHRPAHRRGAPARGDLLGEQRRLLRRAHPGR